MKTTHAAVGSVPKAWHLVDAEGRVLGRLATEVAGLLRGKHKPAFSPHMDHGDFVIVVNAEKVVLTGRKWKQKVYYRHSGYPGGLKATTAEAMRRAHPERIVEHAVRGMLPKTRLGDALYRKLKVYAGPAHPHASQRPVPRAAAAA